jgi:adenylosuccinate lyase
MSDIPNVLAERYATPAMKALWSQAGRIVREREFWIAALAAQRELGLPVPPEAVAAYERVKDRVDLESIRRREARTRHDVKARIEEFCALAGCEHIHKGLTSRDLTENVEQLLILRSLELVRGRSVSLLSAFRRQAERHAARVITARTHNVAAQPTTLGKRLAMYGEELLHALERLDGLIARYPLRGLKGAVGTQLDQLTLLGGDPARVEALEQRMCAHLGFAAVWGAVGQVYPRSLDFETVSALYQLGSAPASFAKTLRLMAGYELASEGFAEGQVGSSAMPHKMNSRSCERINGFHAILRGHLAMAECLAGDQWNEGDVSCSVVRRVVFPDCFLAMDGMIETTLVVLGEMEVYPAAVERENARYQPFLATTTILMEAVKAGAGREAAHEAIREHAVATARDLRHGRIPENDLLRRLAADPRVRLGEERLRAIVMGAESLIGNAATQVSALAQRAGAWERRYPEAAAYKPGAVL